ncbi:MAG TPA: hypothetical protein VKS81_05830, partial [Bacteroidota bacterium]|nr:hypothetical protein [Bacteroidota bacterium]
MKRLFSLFAFCLLVVMTYAFGIAGPPGSRIVTNPPNAKYEGVYQILRNRASVSGIPFNQAILSDRKCGLKMMEMIHRLRPTMTAEERSEIDRALATNGYQKDRVIGHFDIFYDTTGDNEPFLIDSSNVPISGTAEQYIDSVGY